MFVFVLNKGGISSASIQRILDVFGNLSSFREAFNSPLLSCSQSSSSSSSRVSKWLFYELCGRDKVECLRAWRVATAHSSKRGGVDDDVSMHVLDEINERQVEVYLSDNWKMHEDLPQRFEEKSIHRNHLHTLDDFSFVDAECHNASTVDSSSSSSTSKRGASAGKKMSKEVKEAYLKVSSAVSAKGECYELYQLYHFITVDAKV